MKSRIVLLGCLLLGSLCLSAALAEEKPNFVATQASRSLPNVLFIAIDDLNDWIGPLAGHTQAKTPNMARLAQRGVVFANAHCAAPICNPSRAAVFSGQQPFKTGVFSNDGPISDIRKVLPDSALLPKYFESAGYHTYGTGKLLHKSSKSLYNEEFYPHQRWSPFEPTQVNYTDTELPSKKSTNPRHATTLKGHEVILPLNRMPSDRESDASGGESFDWGPLDVEDEDMGDGQIATWAAKMLRENHQQPFFLAVGFYRPHIPLFAPKKYFDLYNDVDIKLPEVKVDDLDDLSAGARERALEPVTAGSHATVIKHDQWRAAVKGYLACVSFVDAQVGRLLDALDSGPNAGNTIIVLWGDHGWHLGEKQHWGKWTGWERSTRVPLIISPNRDVRGQPLMRGERCDEPVSLLDLYPTLIDLCSLPQRDEIDGQSLVPLLTNPAQSTDRVVLTTFGPGNYSAMGRHWHYIRYSDGAEELYDRSADPQEWTNLAEKREYASMKAELAKSLPASGAVQ